MSTQEVHEAWQEGYLQGVRDARAARAHYRWAWFCKIWGHTWVRVPTDRDPYLPIWCVRCRVEL